MNPAKRAALALAQLFLWSAASSCGQPPAAVVAPAAPSASAAPAAAASEPAPDPPEGPVPTLRTGSLAPIEDPSPVAARVVRRNVDAHFETLLIEFEQEPNSQGVNVDDLVVSVPPLHAFATQYAPVPRNAKQARPSYGAPPPFYVWARRPAADAKTPLAGEFFIAADGRVPGKHCHFRPDLPAARTDHALVADWMTALAGDFGPGPFKAFATDRLGDLARPGKAPVRRGPRVAGPSPALRRDDDLARLMETTTGATAVQEALQADRSLFLSSVRGPTPVALASLHGPELARHPWGEMLRRLGTRPPAEALAALAPADFYYVRVAGVTVLLRLLDQVDSWGTAAAQIASGDAENRAVAARYMAELGLDRGPLTSVLGPAAVSDLALVGSDPYVREGSDVTILFHVQNAALFDSGLAAALAMNEQAHGHVAVEALSLAGVDVKVARSADGAVHQLRATVGDVAVVSNSPAALKHVLETTQGKSPRLADEIDFQYMLARDAATHADGLAYMGDRFVAEVVGPRQKIAEARRQVALAELMTPGFSALLYGVMNGRSPASVDEIVAAGLLARAELSHGSGAPIAWRPGEAARSTWGTPASLAPLVDLPSPDRVTESEKAGYERFARGYQSDWARYIDPVALRIALEPAAGGGTRMTFDLRELPLLAETEYSVIRDEAGEARFAVSPPGRPGARVVVGIGESSELRHAAEFAKSLSDRHQLKFDWLGDWAMVGVEDQPLLATLTHDVTSSHERALLEAPGDGGSGSPDESSDDRVIGELTSLRVYAAIGIRSPLGATLALAGLRAIASETAPGLLEWGESSTHRGVPIVRVSLSPKKAREEFGKEVSAQLFYAIADGAILLALRESVLRAAIDDRLDGKGPKAPADKTSGTQLAMDIASDRGSGLWTALAWLFETGLLDNHRSRSAAMAEALLRGAPEHAGDAAAMRALAIAYYGAAPLTPDGGSFGLQPDGLVDPARGTAYAPVWPAVPVPGSPLEAVMGAFSGGRTEVSFDDEGKFVAGHDAVPLRSLHARVTLDVR